VLQQNLPFLLTFFFFSKKFDSQEFFFLRWKKKKQVKSGKAKLHSCRLHAVQCVRVCESSILFISIGPARLAGLKKKIPRIMMTMMCRQMTRRCLSREPPMPSIWGGPSVPSDQVWVVERDGVSTLLEEAEGLFSSDKLINCYTKEPENLEVSAAFDTADGITITVHACGTYETVDPIKCAYAVEDDGGSLSKLASERLAVALGEHSLSQVPDNAQCIAKTVWKDVNNVARDWGINCVKFTIGKVEFEQQSVESMATRAGNVDGNADGGAVRYVAAADDSIRLAAIRRDSMIVEAEGMRASQILEGEAEADVCLRMARAKAEAIELHAAATARALETIRSALPGLDESSVAKFVLADRCLSSSSAGSNAPLHDGLLSFSEKRLQDEVIVDKQEDEQEESGRNDVSKVEE
jgi:regulator of protease activity HflC (stomatin/prohibitin superfamily)